MAVIPVTTGRQYTELVKSGRVLFKFFSFTCSHCLQVAPLYIKMAELFAGSVTLAEVDISSLLGATLANDLGFQRSPTFVFYAASDGDVYRPSSIVLGFNGVVEMLGRLGLITPQQITMWVQWEHGNHYSQ